MIRLRPSDLIFALSIVAGAASLVRAQAFTATLLGTVADSGGGVLPGATITITNTGNGQEWTAVADAQGRYTVPLLPPGAYRVSAELQGFKRGVREPIALQVNQQQRADFTLDLGSMTEEVVVSRTSFSIPPPGDRTASPAGSPATRSPICWINYDNPSRTALTPNFGKIFSAGPPRQIQLGLRFMF